MVGGGIDSIRQPVEHSGHTAQDAPLTKAPWRLTSTDAVIMGLLALWVIGVQSFFLITPHIYDPSEYMIMSSKVPDIHAHHRSLRIGLLLPTTAAIWLFGYTEAAFYFMPYLGGLILTLATYWLGRLFFGRVAGAAAGALVVANPYVLRWSSQLFPDVPAAAFLTLTVALLVYAGIRVTSTDTVDRATRFALVAAGITFALSYLVREFILLYVPILILVVVLYRYRRAMYGFILVPMAAIVSLEWVWGWLVYGDPFIRARTVVTRTASTGRSLNLIRESADPIVETITTFPRLLLSEPMGWLFLALGLALIAGTLIARDRRFVILTAWVVGISLAFSLMALSQQILGIVILRIEGIRYWYPVFPALVIGGFGGITVIGKHLVGSRDSRWAQTAPAVAVGVVALATVATGLAASNDPPLLVRASGDHYQDLRTWLADEGQAWETIWTDQHTGWLVPMYANTTFGTGDPVWDGTVRYFNVAKRFKPVEDIDSGLVVFQDQFFRAPNSNWRDATPDYLISIPDAWEIVYITENRSIVVYDVTGDPTQTTLISIGDGLDFEWQEVSDTSDVPRATREDDGYAITIPRGESVTLTDASSNSLRHPIEGIAVEAGEAVRVDVELGAAGAGWVEVVCWFYGPDGKPRRQLGSTGWGRPHEFTDVEYTCRAPLDEGTYSVRAALELRGPIDVTFGDMHVAVQGSK